MITHAVLCPGPPLLAAPADPLAARLRVAVGTAVDALVATGPEVVAVIGVADEAGRWPSYARPDLAAYGLPRPRPASVAPLSVGLGALMLDESRYAGELVLRTVNVDAAREQCVAVAAELAGAAGRVGLLVVADGSARRTPKAPGYFDERAGDYDAGIERAVASGDLAPLFDLDPALAAELMAPGRAALLVLAAAFDGQRPRTVIHYADAPFGVGYLVASLTGRC